MQAGTPPVAGTSVTGIIGINTGELALQVVGIIEVFQIGAVYTFQICLIYVMLVTATIRYRQQPHSLQMHLHLLAENIHAHYRMYRYRNFQFAGHATAVFIIGNRPLCALGAAYL